METPVLNKMRKIELFRTAEKKAFMEFWAITAHSTVSCALSLDYIDPWEADYLLRYIENTREEALKQPQLTFSGKESD